MSLALSGDTVAYLMGLGLDAEQMKGLIDRLNRDALAMTPPSAVNGVNEERERLRNESTYQERKREKDRLRRAAEREELRLLKAERGASTTPATTPATTRDYPGEAMPAEGDNQATIPDPPLATSHVEDTSLPSLRSEEITPKLPSVATPKGAAPSKPKERRSRFVPDDWSPTPSDLTYAEGLGFCPGEMERELAKFRRYEFARPYSHWSRTFQTWLDKAAERRPKPSHERPSQDAKFDARQANLTRAFAGADRAAGRDWKP
jgi:hypothetical protein